MMTLEQQPSSNDDASQTNSASTEDAGQPWWATHPAILAARDAAAKWIESAEQEPLPVDNSAAVHTEVVNGSCWRELRAARNDLDRAHARYANAVRAARAVGFSWGEIGRVLGVPRQLLHRRFRNDVG